MMKLSKDLVIALFQFRGNFIMNKKSNSYEFKIQVTMQRTNKNLLFLKTIKENYLNDIGRISIEKKSMRYIIQKHDHVNYFIKDFLLYDNPFIIDKKEYYELWKQTFKYYKTHFFKGSRSSIITQTSKVAEKMADYHIKMSKLKNHRDSNKELSKHNKPKSYVSIDKFL